ncbi:MAG: hypothetical protein IAC55_04775 [Tyzzerella sp.]|uniref:Bypass of forespore C C-terminal domain-containing protein n=1 Tax=Candidatus Fimicola merdigallinarum TaxID=2840819 RepID=A0A9D9DYL5_9FIRM|nr:hypothetical protein [Candidatus Fimicola merdigallinarum]
MTDKRLFYVLSALCIIICVSLFGMGFYMYIDSVNNKKMAENMKRIEEAYKEDKEESKEDSNKKVSVDTEINDNDELEMVIADNKISESTKMVYQYYYKDESLLEESEEVPPYFLIGFDFNDMLEYYPDWQIVSFSGKRVVMRKIVDTKNDENFVVTQKDGYIAVYYEDSESQRTLYEITETPVSTLTQEEQVRINDGIIIKGEYELAKVLAEYNS